MSRSWSRTPSSSTPASCAPQRPSPTTATGTYPRLVRSRTSLSEEDLQAGVRLTRIPLDRHISTALRPAPAAAATPRLPRARAGPGGTVLAARARRGLDRLRHPLRRLLEVLANAGAWARGRMRSWPRHRRRMCSTPRRSSCCRWSARPPDADPVGSCTTSPITTPRPPASRGCQASCAGECVRRRERAWARDAAGTLAVSEPIADLVQPTAGASPGP